MKFFKNTTRLKILLVILLVIAVACEAFFIAAYEYYHSKVQLLQTDDGIPDQVEILDQEPLPETADLELDVEELPDQEIVQATGEIPTDERIFNVLLIGTDERKSEFSDSARGDTCILLSINKETMEVKMVSFERGTAMPILSGQYQGQYDWLTHTFHYGGANLMMQEIRECFRVDVDHYVRVNICTFMELIDSVGGIDIELTSAEANYIRTYAEKYGGEMRVLNQIQNVSAGPNHLNGATAMMYVRCRKIDSDWKRVERQRNVIRVLIEQAKGMSLSEIDSMLNTVLPLAQTNLTEDEITSLLLLAPKASEITIDQMTLPAQGTYGGMTGMEGRSMYATDFQKNADILKEFLYGDSDNNG